VSSVAKCVIRSFLLPRLIALILIVGGLPMLVLAYLSAKYSSESLIRQSNLLQATVGQSVGSAVSAHVQACIRQLELLKPVLLDSSSQSTHMLRSRAASMRKTGFLGFRALNANRRLILAGGDSINQVPSDVVENTVAAAFHSDSPAVSRPEFSSELSELVFAVAIPAFNRSVRAGALLGVFSLEPALAPLRRGSWFGAQMLLTDRTGSFVATIDRNRMLKSADYRENELIKFFAANAHELGAVTHRVEEPKQGSRIPIVATGLPVAGTNWVTIAEVPESDAYAEAGATVQNILVPALGLLLLSMGTGAVWCYRLARPMAQLAESARGIAAGNESIEIPSGHDSEAGVVAKAFGEMSEQAKQNLSQMKQAVEDSKQLLTGILRALASAIDAKDPYTRGHSERVTRFAVEIAKIMGLPDEDIERIKLGALIHDVGKIGIDDRVLKKPGVLSDEEYRVMKTHTTCGYEMMKHIPQLKDILPGIQSHHEHLNGKGYPRGLKANEIPMIARVITVADCFDAMTTKRPHHDPAPIDQVLAEIRSLAGKNYDEKAVEALIRGVKTGQIIPHLAT